jgi:acyl transferase domain-containing protein/tryptophanase/acyl carrier protein
VEAKDLTVTKRERKQELTQKYVESVIRDACEGLGGEWDVRAPFGEMGVSSFQVLKIIKRLESDFGRLPKSLLFEYFNVRDLASYFVGKHEGTVAAMFARQLQEGDGGDTGQVWELKAAEKLDEKKPERVKGNRRAKEGSEPTRIAEKEAHRHEEWRELVTGLYERYKLEGCVSRGTRKIGPNLFIGSARRGYFNYGRSKNILLVYGYTGPREYLPELLEEIYEYCENRKFQLNILADEAIASIGGVGFSATPFGVVQRIGNLRQFGLEGGAMRRLRYQVSKFERTGAGKTEEYRCGSDEETDRKIAGIIDRWCENRSMVNPLVGEVKKEILAGALSSEHRLFLTYLDGQLLNVILITALCAEASGYLMDLEFYPPEMPLGGLEFAIVKIIEALAAEGCEVLSLGGTYGCKLEASAQADPEVDKILDELRGQHIFSDEGNLQFKNKFRPENKTVFLCRPVGGGPADNVIDIIMMIADPEKMQTSEEENYNYAGARGEVVDPVEAALAVPAVASLGLAVGGERWGMEAEGRWRTLSECGWDAHNLPRERVELDLQTDSWAQLQLPAIERQQRHLQEQLQRPVEVEESLRGIFPFAHFVLTGSGQGAEHIFFQGWSNKGLVLQNLLFPSTIFHEIDQGFTIRELPHPALLAGDGGEAYTGEMDEKKLHAELERTGSGIALVCVEVGNNASGGQAVSLRHLREVKGLLGAKGIPLVIDGTRVLENAWLLVEQEKECAGKSAWAVVSEIFSLADAVIGSLSKDFCVKRGGIIATNDGALCVRLQELAQNEGVGIDGLERKKIALALQERKQIEAGVLRRMAGVRRIGRALQERHVPIVQPVGGHCVLIDVKQIEEFRRLADPVASFVAWLYLQTGIRAGAHSVGMQAHARSRGWVRLAVPVGLKAEQIELVIERLITAFDRKENIPEIVKESSVPRPLGGMQANYKLLQYHKAAAGGVARTEAVLAARNDPGVVTHVAGVAAVSASSKPAGGEASGVRVGLENLRQPEKALRLKSAGLSSARAALEVAIVGMAGRYPKAKNLRELWKNLAQGRDCIEEIPAERYAWRQRQGNSERYRGGFLSGVDKFDSLFFNISPREAEMLDPQERLFLEVAWETIEDAGYYPEILGEEYGPRNVGVFVGAVWAMYQMLGVEGKPAGKKAVPNSFLWSIANRVSYWLNLCGPSMTVDTACSSSLTALYLGWRAIRDGECSAALVGGVNLDLHAAKLEINRAGGALSVDGVCRSFGQGANGYVAGEGVGALFLKPVEQAVKDGDNIYGLIRSAVVNHGGRTSGYTVPNPKAQSGLIVEALERANLGAQTIGYVEAHGTGTELGDPIEVAGLSEAFGGQVEKQSCALGSIKSNIGHLEAAAGVVGISKVLLQMKHRQLAPSLHSRKLNEHIDFENSPFYVVQGLEEWKAREEDGVRLPLRAGVSSFGAGGANAHIILESYEPVPRVDELGSGEVRMIFPLSARDEEQLRGTAGRLEEFLRDHRVDLGDVAYTLQIGRKSFEHRVAIVAGSREELLEKLGCFVAGKKHEDIVVGQAKNGESITRLLNRREKEEIVRLLSQGRDGHRMAALWTEGLLADWRGFPQAGAGKRISLPTYPFADKRHWVPERLAVRETLVAGLHPMVDSNESTFERQLFKKIFHERDFFLYDHHVADIATLPGVAYLELARKAGELAAGRKVQKIKNIVWVSPIAVSAASPQKEVFIELKPSGATVRFEVFSQDEKGSPVLHSQGMLQYASREEAAAESEYIDLESIRRRCAKAITGPEAYPLFRSFGLHLGASFQVVQQVYKNEKEVLGELQLAEFRQGDLASMVLHPSLVDGSLQAGMAAQLGDKAEEMLVPYSIGEVEILHELPPHCYSYVTEAKQETKEKTKKSRVLKSNVLIVDETGKVLVKLSDSTGVPLREMHKKPGAAGDEEGFTKLYYAYEWEPAPLVAEKAVPAVPTAMVLFAAEESLRDGYRQRLRETGSKGDEVIWVRPGESFQDLGGQCYEINAQNKDDFTRLFAGLMEKGCRVENICFAWPVGSVAVGVEQWGNESWGEELLERGVFSFLHVCQALIQQKLESKVQLLYLYAARDGERQPHHEAMRGFVNTLHLEHPKLICKTVEVRREGVGGEAILDAVAAEMQAHTQDATGIRYAGGQRSVKKLKAFSLETAAGSTVVSGLRDKGVYLITGGAGGLGLLFAEFLAKQCQARLVLSGRSALSGERRAKVEQLKKLGAEVVYLSADVSHYEEVEKLVEEARSRYGEIHGVIHAAGVLRDSLIRNKTAEEMSAVLAPKVHGTRHLDKATRKEKLDFFVTFSSLAAVAGNAGQCDYSFANHFMDSFAAGREVLRAQGARSGKTLSVNWSLWADGGMKLDEPTEQYFKKTLGIRGLSAETGVEALVQGLASTRTQFAVLEGVQEKVELAWGLRKKKPAASVATPSAGTAPVAAEAGGDLVAWLQSELSQLVMEFLKLEAGDMATDKILLDLGFDSIGLTTFANAINEKFQLDITPVLFFDYPSVGEIAKYLAVERESEIRRFYRGSATAAASVTPPSTVPPTARPERKKENTVHEPEAIPSRKGWDPAALEPKAVSVGESSLSPQLRFSNMPIAIVGMSGVMPQSQDLEEFWENLKDGKDLVTLIPPDRWRWEDYYGDPLKEVNKSNSKWGGFMREVDKFDPLFFGISPREAQMMDPQQRIFLEHVWKAIEDSGHKVSDLSGTKTGLFVGVATNDYINVMNTLQIALDGYSASGNSHSVLANRVSFLLNLRGPSAPIDTACSSSLVALHRALESIHTGSCEMAIVGGVQVMLSPAAYISFGMAGMLSSDGKSKAFDKRANGYVRGEGCGAIFLKPLARAEADGNPIYAVIKATAENHGGRVTTMTAPNSAAQSALLIEAYEKAQIDPRTVGYIECHGTGTSLGDPIEIQALSRAFAELYKKSNHPPAETPHCSLGSVKTNIGHLETAAGIASLLKALLAIKHQQIPANIHFEELNPYINLKGTPFHIAQELTPWEAVKGEDRLPLPRRAGVSSFGFGGANAHVVLEEYLAPQRPLRAQEPQLIVLSAKEEDRLQAYVESLHAYLEKTEVELDDLAYTLQVGRDEMRVRLALVVSSTKELQQKLQQIGQGRGPIQNSYRNQPGSKEIKYAAAEGPAAQALDQALAERNLAQLAELWVAGAKIHWPQLHGADLPRRISLPTYPFARQQYWIPNTAGSNTEARKGSRPESESTSGLQPPLSLLAERIHPVLPSNEAATPAGGRVRWLFSREQISKADGIATPKYSLGAAEKIELFLKQEIADELQKPIEDIPTDQHYFELGLTSLGIVDLIQKVNQLLDENLFPIILFERRDIRSLAEYLADMYPSTIDAITLTKQEARQGEQKRIHGEEFTALPREKYFPSRLAASETERARSRASRPDLPSHWGTSILLGEQILEQVLWKEISLDESYERVEF